jgi:hypothetical protein
MPTRERSGFSPDDVSPAESAEAVTPSDSTDLVTFSRALWIGGAGNIAVIMRDGSGPFLISGIPAGTLLPIRVQRVNATNTTATLIVALS